ncbi:unnamed protein product [Brachionus calyciflorus]|uniref:UNC93-like protein n=1 Tax=Brachionus calyciflorus TaxID=104777 RepID=A0A813XNF4_9BILA|nr:unnamed protein product [Brachionus calyciflorus]
MSEIRLPNDTSESEVLNEPNVENKAKKRKVIKNLIVFSISYLLQFSAAAGLNNLQSSLNSYQNLGVTALLTASLTFTLTCLFLPNIMLRFMGFKWPLILTQSFISLFILANFKATFWTLIPMSILFGIALGSLWTYQGTFVAHLAHDYNKYSAVKNENILVKFFGIFFLLFQLHQVIGNTVSPLVLNHEIFTNLGSSFTLVNQTSNLTCGSSDCPGPASVIPRPPDNKVYIICSIYLSISLLGVLSILFFMDDIKPNKDDISDIPQTVKDTFKLMFTSLRKILLVPYVAFTSLFVTFLAVELAKSYLACAYGMHTIGLWFIIWGLTASVSSIFINFITKHIKKTYMLISYVVIACGLFIYLLYWDRSSPVYKILSLAVIMGFLDTINSVCFNATLGDVFHDKISSAYAANRFTISTLNDQRLLKMSQIKLPSDNNESKVLTEDSVINDNPKIRRNIKKNLIVFSLSYLLQFSAANGLNNLQSSLNSYQNLGITSLLVSAISFSLSCLFLPSIMLRFLGFKWPLVICQSIVALFIVANFKATFWTLIPVSFFFGIALSTLWTYQGTFVAHLAHDYNKNSSHKNPNILVKFFGIFFILFQLNQVFGNLISSIVLNPQLFENFASSFNLVTNRTTNFTCGSQDCPGPASVVQRPNDEKVYLLCSIYLSISILGVLLIVFLLDNIRPDKDDLDVFSKTIKDTIKLICTSLKKILLLPTLGFFALMATFVGVEMSKSYIACAYGIHSIGLWFVIWGVSSSIFSTIIGHVTKYVRKTFMLMLFVSVNCAILVYLLFWSMDSQVWIIISFSIVFGCLDTTYATCMNATIGDVFHDKLSPAYAANRFSISLFFLLSYACSEFFCVYQKINAILGLGAISLITLIIFEFKINKKTDGV